MGWLARRVSMFRILCVFPWGILVSFHNPKTRKCLFVPCDGQAASPACSSLLRKAAVHAGDLIFITDHSNNSRNHTSLDIKCVYMWHDDAHIVGEHPCIHSKGLMEMNSRRETRWRIYCKVIPHDHNTHDTLSQVENHWIITQCSNLFVLDLIQNHTLMSGPLWRPLTTYLFHFSLHYLFLFTKGWRHTNFLLWESHVLYVVLNTVFLSFICQIKFNYIFLNYSQDNFPFVWQFHCIFILFISTSISASLSPVIRRFIKVIPWTRKTFQQTLLCPWFCVLMV